MKEYTIEVRFFTSFNGWKTRFFFSDEPFCREVFLAAAATTALRKVGGLGIEHTN